MSEVPSGVKLKLCPPKGEKRNGVSSLIGRELSGATQISSLRRKASHLPSGETCPLAAKPVSAVIGSRRRRVYRSGSDGLVRWQ